MNAPYNPPLVAGAARFADRTAIVDADGEHTYGKLLSLSAAWAAALSNGTGDLNGERVAYAVAAGRDHVALQWAIWRAGGIAVPLAVSHPAAEMAYTIGDARPLRVVASSGLREVVQEACAGAGRADAFHELETLMGSMQPSPAGDRWVRDDGVGNRRAARRSGGNGGNRGARYRGGDGENRGGAVDGAVDRALGGPSFAAPTGDAAAAAAILYTSGTTGRPKGVVITHANLLAQVSVLVDAWRWRADDRILHVLPLHHVHGMVNAMSCALAVGATCEFGEPRAEMVWRRLARGGISLLMAVPTIYRRLIAAYDAAAPEQREAWAATTSTLRLMVSGSAALPAPTLERWQEITGHRLLERYGMTEIGMALGNPLGGERRAGTVGQPFAGVEARIVGDDGNTVAAGEQGCVEVRGPQVFREYWGRPRQTRAAFTADGWFRTGDEALVDDGYWRLVGRTSVDIIKTGGYKVSALEIEAALRDYPGVRDAAVVGVVDEEWGERVCAALLVDARREFAAWQVRSWCRERLAPYKVPKEFRVVECLPRNAVGKVLKPQLRAVFTDSSP